MSEKICIGVIGGTGYGAGELLRLLSLHPQAEVVSLTSTSLGGKQVSTAHPQLEKIYSQTFSAELDWSALPAHNSVIFAALPHGVSATTLAEVCPRAQKAGVKVVDLSGDFRLQDLALHQAVYGSPGLAELRRQFVYGLPELGFEDLARANFVSNPGCLAAACILAAFPLVRSLSLRSIVFDAKTGSSGAGKSPSENFHHPQRHNNMVAYKILEHRHEPEIRQALRQFSNAELSTAFVPHLLPSARGIFVTLYGELSEVIDQNALHACFAKAYEKAPFVRLVETADLHAVIGSNFCDISVRARGKQVVVMATLDNLVKGMAGQAIQNMNLLFGLPETTGLWFGGLGPS